MHEILGLPLIFYPIRLARKIGSGIIVVVGHGREIVEPYLSRYQTTRVVQDPPLGTGHAILVAREVLKGMPVKNVVILPGDMPLIEYSSLASLIEIFESSDARIGVLTACLPDPFGYGRIIRDGENRVKAIVEHNDATDEQKKIREINTGVYVIDKEFLLRSVDGLSPDNAKQEFYLTDIVRMADSAVSFVTPDFNEAHGINSRLQLSQAAAIMQQRINRSFMDEGVTLIDPESTWISPLARVGNDVEIWPHVHIMGESIIGSQVRIMPNVWISGSDIGTGSIIGHYSLIENSVIAPDTDLPAYSSIRGKTQG
jgi:bifunctional UDP-N-acetylglucosamine pyrophosphorylase/glucosamine-1-phosphate N-acetyltransferase